MNHDAQAADRWAVYQQQPDRGMRVVALFEATKGLLVLLAGCGLLALLDRDAQAMAEELVSHFHLNPASRYPRIFLQLTTDLSNGRLWMFASIAFMYATVRLVEAYGLWRQRRWAEWFAVASGSIYIPIEVYELLSGVSWIKTGTLTVNLMIVAYMAYALRQQRRKAVAYARQSESTIRPG